MSNIFPKKKQHQILLLVMSAASAAALIWYALVDPARSSLKAAAQGITQLTSKLQAEKRNAGLAEGFKNDLETAAARLRAIEEEMPEGDLYRWLINTLLPFQAQHHVEFSSFEPPQPGDLKLWPNSPYKLSAFSVMGTATYHNFGKFLAEFENAYPHFALRALDLEPVGSESGSPEDDHNLRFRMEFVTPVKPTENR
jgi:hypothetical protein